jgi:hypothetical protein
MKEEKDKLLHHNPEQARQMDRSGYSDGLGVKEEKEQEKC